MRNLRKKCFASIACLSFMCIAIVGISAKAGWTNTGWSNIDWSGKACNSETTVFDTPRYSYMSTTAKIGTLSEKKEASKPSPNVTLHAWRVGSLTNTCEYWGNDCFNTLNIQN
ncbi:MAG: hypothetical protein RR500_09090 [Bacilli bacterium]